MRRSIIFIPLCFVIFCSNVNSQSFLWADGPGGIGNDVGTAVASDADGNAYMTGYYSGQCDFQGTFFFSNNGFEIFLTKYNPAGTLLWVKKAGGVLQDQGTDVIVGNDGMIYLTGVFRGTATFESTTLISNGNADVFLAKYDPSGSLIWVKSFGGSGEDLPAKLSMTTGGEILVCGIFSGAFLFNGSTHTALGYNDLFLCQWNAAGNPQWVKYYGGVNDEYVTGLFTNPENTDIWMSGYFYYDTDLGGTALHSAGSSDVFVARLDVSGGTQWAIRSGGALAEVALASASGINKATWITGYFLGHAQFGSITLSDTGYNDIFLANFDEQGQCTNAIKMGGASLDVGTALTAGDSGGVYLTGSFAGTARLGPFIRTAVGKDIFLASISDAANMEWVMKAGGDHEDYSKGICRTPNGDLLLTGYFYGFAWFGSAMTAADNSGIFLSRISTLPVGVDLELENSQLAVWPQPASDRLFLRSESPFPSGKIVIFDGTGRQIEEVVCSERWADKELNISHLNSGFYLICFESRGTIYGRSRLLIQR